MEVEHIRETNPIASHNSMVLEKDHELIMRSKIITTKGNTLLNSLTITQCTTLLLVTLIIKCNSHKDDLKCIRAVMGGI